MDLKDYNLEFISADDLAFEIASGSMAGLSSWGSVADETIDGTERVESYVLFANGKGLLLGNQDPFSVCPRLITPKAQSDMLLFKPRLML